MGNRRTARALAAAAVGALVTMGIGLAPLAKPGPSAAAQEAKYAGIDACAACHEDLASAFRESIHGQKGFAMRSTHACETCHGPGQAHVDAGGGKGTIVAVKALPKERQSEICLTCHDGGARMDWAGSTHETRRLACEDCHSVHGPAPGRALLPKPETELCFACHKHQKSQLFRSSHHPLREGLMTCSSCHEPHAVLEGRPVDRDAVAETCYRCHAQMRGPFLWEHPPVREDCTTCHEAHGSNHLKLLRAKEPYLCQRCHSDTRHPGTLYDESQLAVASNRLAGRSCTNCHATLHGSNHPSGQLFLR